MYLGWSLPMSEGGRDYWAGALQFSEAALPCFSVQEILSPYTANVCDLSVFVYAHNAQDSIIACLDSIIEAMAVLGHDYELIIIDDASQDYTGDLLHHFVNTHGDIPIVMRKNRDFKGVVDNYIDAAFIGRGRYFRYMHGDNREPVETSVDILRALGEADVIVPYYVHSRLYARGHAATRRVTGWLRMLVTGNNAPFVAASHIHLRYNILRWHSDLQGLAFEHHLMMRLVGLGFTVKYAPCRAIRVVNNDVGNQGFWLNILALMRVLLTRLRRR